MSNSFSLMDYSLHRLHCLWDFPGKNTGVGCPFLLQGSFLTQGSNLTAGGCFTSEPPGNPSKTHSPCLITKKTLDKFLLRDSLQNTYPILLQTVKAIKSKASLRKCHNLEMPKEPRCLNATWCPGWGLGIERGC